MSHDVSQRTNHQMSQQMKRCPSCGALADLTASACACGHTFRTAMAADNERTTNLSAPPLDATRAIPAVSPTPPAPIVRPETASDRMARALRIPFWILLGLLGLYMVAVLIDEFVALLHG